MPRNYGGYGVHPPLRRRQNTKIPCIFPVKQGIWGRDELAPDCVHYHAFKISIRLPIDRRLVSALVLWSEPQKLKAHGPVQVGEVRGGDLECRL